MSEPPLSSTSSKSNGVWKTGTKGLNMMASVASHAAKTASDNIAAVGRSTVSARHKSNDDEGGVIHHDTEGSEVGSSRGLTDSDNKANEKPHGGKNKNVFKKTYKSLKKGANKVNPLRMATGKPPRDGNAGANYSMVHQLGTDEAEDAVLSSVEKRSSTTKAGEDGFRPAGK
jgi:hypothetical protein